MPDQLTIKVEAYEMFNTSFTVADGTQISRGMLLQLTDPRTASKNSAATNATPQVSVGIAAMEKEASDGSTKITVWTKGIFDSVASGAINVGDPIVFLRDGYIAVSEKAGHIASGARIVGHALETASDAERIEWKLDL